METKKMKRVFAALEQYTIDLLEEALNYKNITEERRDEEIRCVLCNSVHSDIVRIYSAYSRHELERNTIRVDSLNEGYEQGKTKGKLKAAKESAKKLLKEKIDVELISRATGLSEKEIEELK